jgi:uncharacterized phage-associated protein
MQLTNSKRFKDEYALFKEKIDAIPDGPVKTELYTLLKQLVTSVKAIDQQCEGLTLALKITNNTTDHRSNLISIRKKIAKMLDTAGNS